MSSSAPTLRELIRSDLEAARRHFGSARSHLFPHVFVPVSHRLAHALLNRGMGAIAHAIAVLCHVLTGAEIRPAARIGPGFGVMHPSAIVIGGGVEAGANLLLWGSNTLGYSSFADPDRPDGSPRLGDDVVLLTHASVVGPVTVGDRVLVAAYALVVSDMPVDSRPRGIPARPA